jgi:hypothetical protein
MRPKNCWIGSLKSPDSQDVAFAGAENAIASPDRQSLICVKIASGAACFLSTAGAAEWRSDRSRQSRVTARP